MISGRRKDRKCTWRSRIAWLPSTEMGRLGGLRSKAHVRFAILISGEKWSLGKEDVEIRKRVLLKLRVVYRN